MRLTRVIYKIKMKKTEQACFELLQSIILQLSLVATKPSKTSLWGVHPQSNRMQVAKVDLGHVGTKEMESNNYKKRRLNYEKATFTSSLCNHQT